MCHNLWLIRDNDIILTYLESLSNFQSNDAHMYRWTYLITFLQSMFQKWNSSYNSRIIQYFGMNFAHAKQLFMLITMNEKKFTIEYVLTIFSQSQGKMRFLKISPPTHTPTHPNSVWWHSFWCLTICTSQICEIPKFYYL